MTYKVNLHDECVHLTYSGIFDQETGEQDVFSEVFYAKDYLRALDLARKTGHSNLKTPQQELDIKRSGKEYNVVITQGARSMHVLGVHLDDLVPQD